jgi:archaellum component FlaC
MTESIINQLIQGGAMGLFAAFLVWQHLGMQKRLDHLVERFTEQLDKINTDYDDRIEKMRVRYDTVIEGGRKQLADAQREFSHIRETVQTDVSERLSDNARKLDSVTEKVDEALREIKIADRGAN